MSVAFYIVLDDEKPGFDTSVCGKILAREAARLDAISEQLGIPTLDDFVAMSAEDIGDMLGEDLDIPDQEEKWFQPDLGIGFIAKLKQHIEEHPESVGDAPAVVEELAELTEVLEKARQIGARWHLSVDF